MNTNEIEKIENAEIREQTAYKISKTLDSFERFSPEWTEYIRFVEKWTKVNGPLYAVYSE
jgi:hypothetical protein